MANIIKTPFSDAVGADSVPTKGSSGGQYDSAEVPGGPGRDGGLIAELHRDGKVTGAPKVSGAVKTPFKDAVG